MQRLANLAALHMAIKSSQNDKIERLIESLDAGAGDLFLQGSSAIDLALRRRNSDVARLLITRGLSDLEKALKTQDLLEAALLIVYKCPDKKKIVETRFKLRREGLISQVRKTEGPQLKDLCEDVENLIYDYLIISFTQFLEAIGEWPRVNT